MEGFRAETAWQEYHLSAGKEERRQRAGNQFQQMEFFGWQVLYFQRVCDRPKHELFGTDEAAGEEQHRGVRKHKSIRSIKAGVLCTRGSGGPYGEPNSRSSEG